MPDEFYRLSAKPAITTTADDGSTEPPATQYLSENALTERAIETCVSTTGLGSTNDNALTKDVRVQYAVSVEQLNDHGGMVSGVLWGRRYGWRIGMPLSDDVLALSPMDRVDVIDGANTYRFLVDGLSYVIKATEAYAFFTGIEVGVAPTSNPSLVTRLFDQIEGIAINGTISITPTLELSSPDDQIAISESIAIQSNVTLSEDKFLDIVDSIAIVATLELEDVDNQIVLDQNIAINSSVVLQ